MLHLLQENLSQNCHQYRHHHHHHHHQ
jgi:hypothetical protein